ncbi:MAG: PAS domain-containing protein [Thermoleophilia bacterium]|nr:PAS domain-containing protein [Thermoleophilia bacterium]
MTNFAGINNLVSNFTSREKSDQGAHQDHGLDQDQGASYLSYLGSGLLEILDALPFYVLLIDKNHRILLANKATRNTLGKEASELVGEYCPRVVHGLEHGSYPGCPLEKAVSSNEAVEWEHFDEEKGRWFKTAVYPTTVMSIDGQGVYFHMIQDITAQKEDMESLARALDY